MPRNMSSHGKAKKGTMSRLLKMLFKEFKWQLVIALVCIIFASISNFTSSIFVKNITNTIDEAIRSKGLPTYTEEIFAQNITKILLIMGGVYIVGLISSYVWNLMMALITQKFQNKMRKEMFDHMETLPIKYFDTNAHGDIMSIYTNDTDTIRQLVSQSLPALFQTSFTVLALVCIMLYYSVWLTLIVLIGSIFMFLSTKSFGGKAAKYFVKQQKALGEVEGNIEESINGLKVIKVFCHEEESQKAFDKINDELCSVATVGNINGNILGPVMGNIGNILYVLVAIVGSLLIIFSDSFANYNVFGQVTKSKELIGIVISFLMIMGIL